MQKSGRSEFFLNFFVKFIEPYIKTYTVMAQDLISQTLKTYFLQKGKNLNVIQRYLSIRYRLKIEEKILQKRLTNLTLN